MATRVFDDIKFREQLLKRTSQGKFLPNLTETCPVVWEEMMFEEFLRTHDG